MAKVNLNPENSKIVNGDVFITALKATQMSKQLYDQCEPANRINHPKLGLMYQYYGPYSRKSA
tara:strand:+ start:273 stop:461 length:189 start_codon:yes stop_codon:yes gene_type:complete